MKWPFTLEASNGQLWYHLGRGATGSVIYAIDFFSTCTFKALNYDYPFLLTPTVTAQHLKTHKNLQGGDLNVCSKCSCVIGEELVEGQII